jgi:hypothetical protein
MAWYRPDQWTLLRAVFADGERLEGTCEEWLAFASEKAILKPPPSLLRATYIYLGGIAIHMLPPSQGKVSGMGNASGAGRISSEIDRAITAYRSAELAGPFHPLV